MALYSFIGALYHYTMNMIERDSSREMVVQDEDDEFDKEELECQDDIELEELCEIYHHLSRNDLKIISQNSDMKEKI